MKQVFDRLTEVRLTQGVATIVWPEPKELYFLGVSGGVGETTMSELDPNFGDGHHMWPQHPDGSTPKVWLVARSTISSLARVSDLVGQAQLGNINVDIAGLVVVADAPTKPPAAVTRQLQIASSAVRGVQHIPFSKKLRAGAAPSFGLREFAKFAQEVS